MEETFNRKIVHGSLITTKDYTKITQGNIYVNFKNTYRCLAVE